MSNQETFIAKYGASAVVGCIGTRIFPSVKIAQACLETGYGTSSLANEAFNFFGIKADASWTGEKLQKYDSMEGSNDYYRVYRDWSGSFKDHTDFLYKNPRYKSAGVFSATTPLEQCDALQRAGYATDPLYAQKLKDIIAKYNLTSLDKKKTICELVLE